LVSCDLQRCVYATDLTRAEIQRVSSDSAACMPWRQLVNDVLYAPGSCLWQWSVHYPPPSPQTFSLLTIT